MEEKQNKREKEEETKKGRKEDNKKRKTFPVENIKYN